MHLGHGLLEYQGGLGDGQQRGLGGLGSGQEHHHGDGLQLDGNENYYLTLARCLASFLLGIHVVYALPLLDHFVVLVVVAGVLQGN